MIWGSYYTVLKNKTKMPKIVTIAVVPCLYDLDSQSLENQEVSLADQKTHPLKG